ncbi:MAG: hypothetical protein WC516_04930 [Patescibacteria group bacterium]|jgi:hypothetical protein
MRRDFNVLMSDLNGTTREKLVVTTAIVPLEGGCCGCGECCDDPEVYAARVEMDDGQVRGVISHESMEDALGTAVAQAMEDLEKLEEEDYSEDYDYDQDQDYDDDGCCGGVDIKKTIQDAVNKAVEEVLKRLPRQEPQAVSTRHIAALKATVDEVGFDRAVEILEKLNRK